MASERRAWRAVTDWPALNQQLTRTCDVLDQADRVAARVVSASLTLALAGPDVLVDADTTAGSVTITLPLARDVIGSRLTVSKVVGANTLTIAAASGDTINGGSAVTLTTQWASAVLIALDRAWRRVV